MKKSYRGFPIYALLILAVLVAWQMFSTLLGGKTGAKIEYSRMLEYI